MNRFIPVVLGCLIVLLAGIRTWADQVDDLIAALNSGEPPKQFPALAYIRPVDDPRVNKALTALAANGATDLSVRANCISVIVVRKSMESLGTLLQIAGDPKEPFAVRGPAIKGVVVLSGLDHVGLLIQIIQQDKDSLVKGAAAQALGSSGDPKAVPQIRALLNEPRDPAVVPYAVAALAATQDPAVVPDLIDMLKTADPQLKSTIITALGRLGDKRAVPALLELFKEDNELQRISIMSAFASINDPAVAAKLTSLISDKAYSQNIRTQALLAVATLKPAGALQPVASVAGAPGENVLLRQVAARTLGSFGDEAIPILLPLLDDKAVADDAALALGKITGAYLGTNRARWTDFYNDYKTRKQAKP